MRTFACVALLLVGAAALQAGQGIVVPLSVRESNRQVLLSAEGASYDPYRIVQVSQGTPGSVVTLNVPAWQALEMQLDDLEKDGIDLAHLQHLADSQDGGDPPEWPLYGRFKFTEKGYISKGAACPPIQPAAVWGINEQANQANEGGDVNHTLGNFTTTVSEAWQNSSTERQHSFLSYWNLTNTNVNGAGATKSWAYGRNTAEGWTIHVGGHIDYFCVKTATLVHHQSAVDPFANRTDRGVA